LSSFTRTFGDRRDCNGHAGCTILTLANPNQDPVLKQVLILFAHPALQKSRVNRVLIEGLRELPGVTFHDLYEAYPDFDIDVRREQQLLLDHDIVVFMHPFFWYSTPAILKEWQDLVLEHGWAYGREGIALRGKRFLSAISTGGREVAYQRDGHNRFTIPELLAPLEQTARLCGMEVLPPFVAHGTHGMQPDEIARHARDWRRIVEALRDERVDMAAARSQTRLNTNLDSVIREEGR
jgi:glutathione-regulated potassium-efflux system ancillary protein KefG